MVHKLKRSKQYIQKKKKQLRINVTVKLTLTFMKKRKNSVEKLLAFRIYWKQKQGQESALEAGSAIRRTAANCKMKKKSYLS